MPSTLQLVIDLLQLGPHPFRLGLAPNPEPPLPPGRTDVRETQEGERLRLAQPPRPTTFGRVASEFDQPRLVRVQLQTELGEPVAKRGKEPVGVVTMLKPDGEIVRETHDNDVAARLVVSPPIDPQVEDVVQIHVGEQRRYRCSLRCTPLGLRPDPVLDDPCGQPLIDQPQDPRIRDPVLEKPSQPSPIKLAEKVADVRVEHPVHLLALQTDRQRVQRVVGATPVTKSVGKATEVRLVDRARTSTTAGWRILSSNAAMPSGRSRPSAFGMYTRLVGL